MAKIKSLKEEKKFAISKHAVTKRKVKRPRQFRNKKRNIPRKPRIKKGVVYLSHIPHGFYEDQIEAYFKQFGKVTAVSVPRSKTGRVKGYAFIEFRHCEVAEIAAETMNNYLMFNRLLKAKYIPPEQQKPHYFLIAKAARKNHRTAAEKAALAVKHNRKLKNRQLKIGLEAKYAAKMLRKKEALKRQLEKLGVSYDFEVEEANILGVFEKRKQLKKSNLDEKEDNSSIEQSESEEDSSGTLSEDIDSVSENEESFNKIISRAKRAATDILKNNPKPRVKSQKVNNIEQNEDTPAPIKLSKHKHSKENETPSGKKLSVNKSKNRERNNIAVMEVDERDEEINFKTPPNVTKKPIDRRRTENISDNKSKNKLKDEKSPLLTILPSVKSPAGKKIRHRNLKRISTN